MQVFKPLLLSAFLAMGSTIASTAMAQTAPNAPAAVAQQGPAFAPQSFSAEGVVVTVNDQPISYSDVRNRAQLILLSLGVQPNQQTIIQAQQRAIESLIDEQVQIQEAATWEVEITDEEVDSRIGAMARAANATMGKFMADLSRRGINPSTLRSQIKADMAWQALVSGRYGSRVRVSDLQINDRMNRVRKSLDEEQVRVSEIFLRAYSAEQRAQMLQGAWDLRRQIEEGAPFGLVAQQFSSAASAKTGGDLGWVSPDQLKSELNEVVANMAPQTISEPIVTDEGVYLVALMEKREPVKPQLGGFELMQLVSASSALDALQEAAGQAGGCANIETAAASSTAVSAVNLGEMALGELNLVYQDAFSNTPEGGATQPLSLSGDRSAIVFVCKRVMQGDKMPSRDDVERDIKDQQIALLADRYLRDLKREATIIRR